MSQITVLTGPNHYAIAQERARWLSEFKKRQGEDSLFTSDAKNISFKELHNECQMAPFLAEKRLLVIDGIPSRGTKEEVAALPRFIHSQALLLFTLPTEPGRKPKLTIPAKAMLEIAKVINFPECTGVQLQAWLHSLATEYGATDIHTDAVQLLRNTVGDDQALLASEVRKLSTYAFARSITVADVALLTSSSAERDVWQLMEYLGNGNVADTMIFIHTLLDRGYRPQALWSTFTWMITVLIQIVAVVDAGETNPWKIAGTVRANPTGVKAILPFARSISKTKLQNIVQTALEADIGLKTGVYKSTAEAPEELLSLIDRSVLTFTR